MKRFFLIPMLGAAAIVAGPAQTPPPVTAVSTATDATLMPVAIKQLQEMKTANEELLKKQEAALQKLDELQQAADELKIFGKRS
ncbi:MAG: hypothetical protein ABR514_08055 [Chthoniobacterales bacterium]